MKVWAVANQKGGVGKTTTAVTLGGLLAERGQRVLLVDLDPHGSMTAYFGHDPEHMEYSAFQLFQGAALSIQALLPTQVVGLHILPANPVLATLERQSPGQAGLGLVLRRALAAQAAHFDHVLIDSPPVLGILMVNALAACDRLIIPVQTDHLAVKGLQRMLSTLEMVCRSRARILPYCILPTFFDRRTQASLLTLQGLREAHEPRLWSGVIPIDTRLRDASRAGLTPSQLDPQSRAVQAYRALLEDLLSAD